MLEFEGESPPEERPKDVEEVVNYVRAMNHGLGRLKELPVCPRLKQNEDNRTKQNEDRQVLRADD